MTELTPLELVALAGAIKGKDLDAAKASLADNSAGNFDFTVRLQGAITKGQSTVTCVTTRIAEPSDVINSLLTLPQVCQLLKSVGIGATRLDRAMAEMVEVKEDVVDAKLSSVFETHAKRLAQTTRIAVTTKGRAANVSVSATVQKV